MAFKKKTKKHLTPVAKNIKFGKKTNKQLTKITADFFSLPVLMIKNVD